MKRLIFYLLPLFLLIACSSGKEEAVLEIPPEPITKIDLHSEWVDSVYKTLSLQDQIAQLVWMDLPNLSDSISTLFNQFSVGAIFTFEKKSSYFQFYSKLDTLKVAPLMGIDNWELPLTFEENSYDINEFSSISDTTFLFDLFDSIPHYLNSLNVHLLKQENQDSILSKGNIRERLTESLVEGNVLPFFFGAYVNERSTQELPKIIIDFHSNFSNLDIEESQLLISGESFSCKTSNNDSIISLISKGEKIVFLEDFSGKEWITFLGEINEAIANNQFHSEVIESNVRKVLALKEYLGKKKQITPSERIFDKKHLISLRSNQYRIKQLSQILLKNENKLLPLKDWNNNEFKWLKIGKTKLNYFNQAILNYADIAPKITSVKNLAINNYSLSNPLIIVLNEKLDSSSAEVFTDKIELYSQKQDIIIVNFEYPENLAYLTKVPHLLHIWNTDKYSQEIAAQAIFGGNELSGKLPLEVGDFKEGYGLSTSKTRMAYSIPELGGFNRDSLKKLDKIAREAIYAHVTPGCQIFAARNGQVVYHKTFGYHTYERNKLVEKQDVYDIASVTKIAATTICGMKMFENGLYNISDSLKDHLPDSLTKTLGYKSRLSNTTFKELFTHTSGLPSGLPIYKFIAYVDSVIGKFDRYYCDITDGYYCVQVANNFYLDSVYLDSLWISMNRIWPGEKKYKYSDANMNMLYQLFRSKLKDIAFDRYLNREFYAPLKLRTTGYLPLDYLDTLKHEIAPTEYDTYWRYQLLKGYVHDPNAALYGGVAGNAGIFSNANDLGVLFYMIMNKGAYGGRQYLKPQTVKRFTTHQEGSHRGLGFDKPTYQSVSTVAPDCPTTAFGHTGFTGICVWADPENDLLFVFVSNRVHPDPGNKKIVTFGVRKRLHQVFYDQLKYNGEYRNEKHPNGYVKEPVL